MNNRDKFDEDRPVPDSAWADLVERLGQEEAGANGQSPDQISASDLHITEIDDLELDGQLRTLGQMDSNDDQFVDGVMNKVDKDPYSESRKHSRLPVLAPVFEVTAGDVLPDNGSVDQHANLAPDRQELQDNIGVGENIYRRLKRNPASKVLLVIGSLGLSLLIGFWAFDWNSENAVKVSDSTAPPVENKKQAEPSSDLAHENERPNSLVNTNDSERFDWSSILDNSTGEPSSPQNETISSIADNQTLPQLPQPKDLDGSNDTDVADMPIELREASPTDTAIVDNRSPVTYESAWGNWFGPSPDTKVQPAGPVAENKDANPNDVETNIAENKHAPIVKFIPDAELDWKLAIAFDRNGLGTIKLNEEEISEAMSHDNARSVLLDVAIEVKRHFAFLELRLGKRIKGVISVGEANFYFDDADRLTEVMELACAKISGLEFSGFDIETIIELRRARRGVQPLAALIDQLERKRVSQYNDEIRTIHEIVFRTKKVLQAMAVDRIAWEKENKKLEPDEELQRLAHERELANTARVSISRQEFRQFAKSGRLNLPPPENSFVVTKGIQKFGPWRLKQQLNTQTPSFDLFRDLIEFRSAEQFVIEDTQKWQAQLAKLELQLAEENAKSMALVGHEKKLEELKQVSENIYNLKLQLSKAQTEIAEPLEELLSTRPDLHGLPLVMGEDCHMDSISAEAMNHISSTVGATISRFDGFGSRDIAENDSWRSTVIKAEIQRIFRQENREETLEPMLRTTDQILQIDHPPLRLELVEALRRIEESPTGIEMLVKKAKYDLVPEIRQAATNALSDYSVKKFRDQFLEGLKYPWHVVAEHSAEALVRLDDKEAVPELVEMLKLDDPRQPKRVDDDEYVQRELVAINHMRNCMLCHAPSRSTSDMGRARQPSWEFPIPRHYYQAEDTSPRAFVRADVVYLRQDFSVIQPVDNNGPWPKDQRFDYLVQNKKLSKKQARRIKQALEKDRNLNREAIVYALRELTDQQPADDSYETWLAISEKQKANLEAEGSKK